ncbi:unnamed protein product [Ascophyllum nodosum]
MLRLGQSSARVSPTLAVRASIALLRCGSSHFPSRHDVRRTDGRGVLLNHSVIQSPNNITITNKGLSASVFHSGSCKRCMSTSTATGGVGGSGRPSPAVQDAPSSGATAEGSVPDTTSVTDAAVIAAGSADQAQAVVEGAPATLEFALSSSSSPSEMAMMAVDGVHSALGMPYWMAIVAITFALRTAILPIGVLAARNSARTAKMQPEMDQLQEAIKADQQSSQMRRAERYRQETRALYKKYDCSLMMNIALPLVQLPIFISFFFGLRKMPEVFPDFATGGALWFENLGAADPYMIFPLTTGVTTLLLAELGGDGMAMATSSTNMRAGMRAMSLVIIPLTMNIPVGVFVYWTTSNLFSVSQTILLKAPAIRRRLGFPDPPKKQTKATPSDKQLGWLDVLGGQNPLKVYREMRHQQEAQGWFGQEAPVMRKGAPLPPPPSMAMGGGGARPGVKVPAATPPPQQPQVVTYAVRPRPAGAGEAGTGSAANKKGGDRNKKKRKRRVS